MYPFSSITSLASDCQRTDSLRFPPFSIAGTKFQQFPSVVTFFRIRFVMLRIVQSTWRHHHIRCIGMSSFGSSCFVPSYNAFSTTKTPSSSNPKESPPSSSGSKLPVPQGGYSGKGHDIFDPGYLDSTGNRRIGVRGYSETTFKIDDTLVKQSVLLMPHSFLLWNAKRFEDINIETLFLFPLLFPAVEVVFIGCGSTMPRLLSPEIYQHFRSKGIVIEATNTINAAASFNVLNSEGRNVCAALLTIEPIGEDQIDVKQLFE